MRKLFSLFAALTLSVGLWAIDNVAYIDAAGQPKTADGVIEITNSSATLEAGWYVVKGEDVQTGTLVCNGAVNIILADGAKLTAVGEYGWNSSTPGIQVSGEGNSLTIYGQSAQLGQLIANGGTDGGAGIGGGYYGKGSNITINGGKITARGSLGAGIGGGCYGEGSHITINGGSVTATGEGDNGGAGIGGGYGENGYNITINGGKVIATGSDNAAGIGGGVQGSGSNITINGGEVTAIGNGSAAGIGGGGGFFQTGSYITINGGTVIANGGVESGAGIGGGQRGTGSYITIAGGTVTANGGYDATSIGNGAYAEDAAHDIFVATSLVVKADGTTVIENDGSDLANKLAGKQYITIEPDIPSIKAAAVAAVNAEIAETDNDNVKAIATDAATAINAATTVAEINALKNLAIANITSAKAAYGEGEAAGYNTGYDDGEAAVRATLPTEGYAGPAVIITKGEKVLTLFNPEKVEYQILEAD